MLDGLHIGIPGTKFSATPPVPRSPSLRASSYRSADGSIAPLRRASSISNLIPETDSTLDNTLKGDNFKVAILKILIKLRLTNWKLSEAEALQVKNIASALTNCVYLLILDNQKLLLRVYGPNVLHLIDRDYETSVLARLAHHKIGPRLLGQFKNGRIEQWLESVEVTPQELRDPVVSRYIARRMREFHDYVTLLPAEMFKVSASVNLSCWIAALPEGRLDPATRKFIEHIDLYRAHVKGKEGDIVFCHNDLQYGNLLRTKGEEHNCLAVIDFEFAGPNPRSFDLVNHFIEWMANYHESPSHVLNPAKYPTWEETGNFLTEYIRFGKIIARREDPVVSAEEVEHLRDSMNLMRAMSHAQWALWGIIQALPESSTSAKAAAEVQAKQRTTSTTMRSARRPSSTRGLSSPRVTGMKSPFLPPISPGLRPKTLRSGGHKSPASSCYFSTPLKVPTEDTEDFSIGESAYTQLATHTEALHIDQETDDSAVEWADDEEDGFDYMGYANQRIGLFYGELLRLQLIQTDDVPSSVKVISLLPCAFGPNGT